MALAGILEWLFSLVQAYGAFSVFIAVLLEEIIIPIPSAIVIMGAAFILIPAGLGIYEALVQITYLIVIPGSIAATIGSFFPYFIGFYGGKTAVEKFHKFLGFEWSDVLKAEKRFEGKRKTWLAIALLRIIPFFPISIISFTAGLLRLNIPKYTLATLAGSIPRMYILGFLGWSLGAAYVSTAGQLDLLGNVIIAIVIILAAFLLYRYRHRYAHHYERIKDKLSKKAK